MNNKNKLILIFTLTLTFHNFPLIRALFSTTHSLKNELINLIKKENKGIKVAIYILSENSIVKNFIEAAQKNVKIEIVIDKHTLDVRNYRKILNMLENKITIDYYKFGPNPVLTPVMHNKYCIFEEQKIVWNGSYNFTHTASHFNQENVIVFDDKELIDLFLNNFKTLQENSKPVAHNKRYQEWLKVRKKEKK